jgi:hypothetical protein
LTIINVERLLNRTIWSNFMTAICFRWPKSCQPPKCSMRQHGRTYDICYQFRKNPAIGSQGSSADIGHWPSLAGGMDSRHRLGERRCFIFGFSGSAPRNNIGRYHITGSSIETPACLPTSNGDKSSEVSDFVIISETNFPVIGPAALPKTCPAAMVTPSTSVKLPT